MKKHATAAALLALFTLPALAAQSGGFVDPNAPQTKAQKEGFKQPQNVVTVKEAKEMKDDSWVTVRGHIEKRLSDDDYLFRDKTGTLSVEIDDDVWKGQSVSPTDNVELQGELDKAFNDAQLEVKQVRKIKG
ncbi:YgiW/YdeI family stress tolerance OB fold protein [Mixta tenebrionis]|uniref:YgiW/YdeI family stress tolerance OB fold protein n=1 Tax=Mixta tenebrionis TaxID=2562439 RepID=A0A506V6V0_9GAMM|nr:MULTISPECIES: NirD/YgiW/YdeI family stress tolerance protein [Mixta]TPW40763.1 YgiW/YdeI family stress tolerance OB fold protein [Mixta tenebrionis]